MRQFLYLDTDIVNSIIAQAEDGLVQSFTRELENTDVEANTDGSSIQTKAKFGSSIAQLLKMEAHLSAELSESTQDSYTDTSREIVNKTLHDAAFNLAYKNLTIHKIDPHVQDYDDIGNYLELTRCFDFVDLEYLEKLFGKEGIVDFLKLSEAGKIEESVATIKGQYSREQQRKAASEVKKEAQKLIAAEKKKYDDALTIIKALRAIIPYNRMLISVDGYLIPLNERYFRIDPSDLGFKYGGEITCVGLLTNIIGEDTDPNDSKNVFASLQFAVNEAMRKILPTKESDLCVIHPIAIYYES